MVATECLPIVESPRPELASGGAGRRGARVVSQGEKWQRGVSRLQAELHERIPLMEYDCATLVQEVRRAELQVETDRELAELYPPHMEHEKQQMLSYGRYVLQGLKSELEAMTAERAHVSRRLPPSLTRQERREAGGDDRLSTSHLNSLHLSIIVKSPDVRWRC